MEWWKFLVLIIPCYFIGNIFWARIISRIKHYNVEGVGSGNPGTMNMLRNLGFKVGLLTLLLDMSKGIVCAIFGYYLFGGGGINGYIGLFTGGLSCLIGNIYPILYKFKGGKGAAIVYGVYCVANPILGVIIFVGGFLFLLLFDYASLVSFFMISIFTIYEAYSLGLMSSGANITLSVLLFSIFVLVWFAHRQNIFRLLTGKENRVNFLSKFIKKEKQRLAMPKEERKELKEKRKEEKQEIKQKEIG